ncbi:MAG: flavin reductase [Clostridia bacterium]|nr:flavin reductase family protein [Eubacteriales bacterium]MDD3867520.1 flavin reductase family protein [Eubacteriales bacterium]MDD4461666.1 flavin reductase family protein [Eubacteriales bacterium]NCC49242.1 flavin reductase [Clostridia bacterium]
MKKKLAAISPCLQPSPNILVSCRDSSGRDNALVVGYCCNCSYDPPMLMVGIVPSRFSYAMVKESGCFVVNLVGKDQRELFDYMGSHSGRDGDKLLATGANVADADLINAPILSDCPVNIECEVVDSIKTGSHEMFAAKIVRIHADATVVKSDDSLDTGLLDLI